MPRDRWLLFVGGPRLGPAVLFWSMFIVLVVVGAALGRSPWTPLRGRHWVLLGIGLSPISIPAAAVVAGFLLVLGWRQARPPQARAWIYDAGQIGLAVWTVTAATVLAVSVGHGLLGRPDMMIAGNGSSGGIADLVLGPAGRPAAAAVGRVGAAARVSPGDAGVVAVAGAGRDPLGALDLGLLQRARPVAPGLPAVAAQGAAPAARAAPPQS